LPTRRCAAHRRPHTMCQDRLAHGLHRQPTVGLKATTRCTNPQNDLRAASPARLAIPPNHESAGNSSGRRLYGEAGHSFHVDHARAQHGSCNSPGPDYSRHLRRVFSRDTFSIRPRRRRLSKGCSCGRLPHDPHSHGGWINGGWIKKTSKRGRCEMPIRSERPLLSIT